MGDGVIVLYSFSNMYTDIENVRIILYAISIILFRFEDNIEVDIFRFQSTFNAPFISF